MNYPRIWLDNGEIRALVYLPDATQGYYRGTRFDWSGVIARVEYRGHRFYSPLHANHDPQRHDSIAGPAEEFSMFAPMGYAEARPGEEFIKIGVGLLQRQDREDYKFYGDYPLLRAGEWWIEQQPAEIRFEQSLEGARGFGYRYIKTLRLVPGKPELIIGHRLVNSGSRRIDVDHYNHNFTLIDDLAYGPDYWIEFPFSVAEPVSIDGIAWRRGNRIEVDQALGDRSLWVELFAGEDPGFYNAALVRNERSGAAVAFRGDAPISRMVFWAVERAACPEPFIRLQLDTGQQREWSIHYRYHAGEA